MSLVIIEYNPVYHKMSNEKSQEPNPKSQINSNFQIPNIFDA